MNLKIIGNLALFALIVFIFSACTKEDQDQEEEMISSFIMTIDGQEIESDVVAHYCVNDTTSWFAIANIEENFHSNNVKYNLVEGNFKYYNKTVPVLEYGLHVLGEEFTGISELILFRSEDEHITVDSITNEFAYGSTSGILRNNYSSGPQIDLMELPYNIDFVAEILQICYE